MPYVVARQPSRAVDIMLDLSFLNDFDDSVRSYDEHTAGVFMSRIQPFQDSCRRNVG